MKHRISVRATFTTHDTTKPPWFMWCTNIADEWAKKMLKILYTWLFESFAIAKLCVSATQHSEYLQTA